MYANAAEGEEGGLDVKACLAKDGGKLDDLVKDIGKLHGCTIGIILLRCAHRATLIGSTTSGILLRRTSPLPSSIVESILPITTPSG